jgi:hypothetical protein
MNLTLETWTKAVSYVLHRLIPNRSRFGISKRVHVFPVGLHRGQFSNLNDSLAMSCYEIINLCRNCEAVPHVLGARQAVNECGNDARLNPVF